MAKKKAVRRLHPTKPGDLRTVAKKLRKYAARFQGLADSLDRSGDEEVGIEGVLMLARGYKEIEKYLGNCQKKISED